MSLEFGVEEVVVSFCFDRIVRFFLMCGVCLILFLFIDSVFDVMI